MSNNEIEFRIQSRPLPVRFSNNRTSYFTQSALVLSPYRKHVILNTLLAGRGYTRVYPSDLFMSFFAFALAFTYT